MWGENLSAKRVDRVWLRTPSEAVILHSDQGTHPADAILAFLLMHGIVSSLSGAILA